MKEETTNYPTIQTHFHDVPVNVIDVNGQRYISGEELGRCLGYANPAREVNKLFSRHRDELEPHSITVKLTINPEGGRPDRVYSPIGAHYLSMFAKTKLAKKVRRWLATLPEFTEKVMERAQEMVVKATQELDMALATGYKRGLTVNTLHEKYHITRQDLERFYWFRQRGLNQKETAYQLGITKDRARSLDAALRDLGLQMPGGIPENKRRKQMADFFQTAIMGRPNAGMPALPEVTHG